jgi:hypothetical protein
LHLERVISWFHLNSLLSQMVSSCNRYASGPRFLYVVDAGNHRLRRVAVVGLYKLNAL